MKQKPLKKHKASLFVLSLFLMTLLPACTILEDAGLPVPWIQTTKPFTEATASTHKTLSLTPVVREEEKENHPDTFAETAIAPEAETLPKQTVEANAETTGNNSEIKKITLWVPPQFDPTQDNAHGANLAFFIEKFTSEHPNVEITLRVKDITGEGSAINALSAARNAAPDVVPSLVLLSRSDMETSVQKGLLQPITTDIFADSASWYNFARQAAMIDNTIYGIPIAGDGLVLAYRAQKLGVDLSDWADILGRGMPIAFTPSNPSSFFASFIYRSLGGKMTNDQGQIALDQEHLNSMLSFFLNGGQNGVFPPSLAQIQDDSQSWQRFTEGSLNLIVTAFSSYKHYQTPDIKVIALPRNNEQEDYPLVSAWNITLTETEPELQKIALSFAEFMASEAVNDEWTHYEGYLPVRNNEQSNWQTDAQYDTMYTICNHGTLIPGNQILTKLFPIINDATTQVIKNAMTPEQAAQYAMDALK